MVVIVRLNGQTVEFCGKNRQEVVLTSRLRLSFGICPHMTEDNKDQLGGKDLLVAYYDIDYVRNPKGSNYWRNRYALCYP